MTIVTGWRAENAIIDGVPVCRYAGVNLGFVHLNWQQVMDDAHEYALKEYRDREWVAKELGDVTPHKPDVPSYWVKGRCVPFEVYAEQCLSSQNPQAPTYSDGFPTGVRMPLFESLGRDYGE